MKQLYTVYLQIQKLQIEKSQMEIQPFDHQLKVRVVPRAGGVLIDSVTKVQLCNIFLGENKENLIKSISYGLSFTLGEVMDH